MIKVTIRKKIGWWIFVKQIKTKMEIPSSWADITYGQWKALRNVDDSFEIAAILSGIPIETIKKLSESSFNKMASVLSFVANPMLMDKYEAPDKIVINKDLSIPLIKDITEKTFAQKLYLHQILQESGDDFTNDLAEIILTYGQPYIDNDEFNLDRVLELRSSFDDLFLVDLYSMAMNYVLQLKGIVENEIKTLQQTTPTTEQIQAGIHMFDEYGVMNTIKALCGGGRDWALHLNSVMKYEYNIALLSMQMNGTQNIFEDNYRKVMKNKR